MRKYLQGFLQLICLATLMMPAMAADRGREHGRDRGHDRGSHWQGDIRSFHEHDGARWRGGHWQHGRHLGRIGWWWIVGATWYFYPAPIYPYPDPYQPPVLIPPPPPGSIATPQYWYYCANPPGYYPYVPQCYVTWQRVPATP